MRKHRGNGIAEYFVVLGLFAITIFTTLAYLGEGLKDQTEGMANMISGTIDPFANGSASVASRNGGKNASSDQANGSDDAYLTSYQEKSDQNFSVVDAIASAIEGFIDGTVDSANDTNQLMLNPVASANGINQGAYLLVNDPSRFFEEFERTPVRCNPSEIGTFGCIPDNQAS